MPPRRRGRRMNRRRPRRGAKKYVGTRRIPGLVHRVKRIALPAYIQNTLGAPNLTQNGGITGAPSFIQSNTVPGLLPGTYDFTLSSQYMLSCLTQVSDMTNFFDRYKIVGVKLNIHYLQNSASPQDVQNLTSAVYNNLPTLYWAFDGDDAAANTGAQIVQKGYCKSRVLNANKPLSIYIKPRVTKEVAGVVTPGVTSEKACWIDCNAGNIPHFGLKFYVTDWVGGNTNNCLRIQPTYYIQFRDTQ